MTALDVGRCGTLSPPLFVNGSEVCVLDAGHDGWHRGEGSSEWSRHYDARESAEFTDDQARRIAALTIAIALRPKAMLHQQVDLADWILGKDDDA